MNVSKDVVAVEIAAVRALLADAQNEAATWQPNLSPIVDPLIEAGGKLADLVERIAWVVEGRS